MSYLFTRNILGWSSWGKVFQSISAWKPLIEYIFVKEHLPFTVVDHLTPGTNAVFKIGEYVIKIFAPVESGIDCTMDIQTETFAMKRSNAIGISVPKCVSYGCVNDKYSFSYMIMEFINGKEFTDIAGSFSSYDEKVTFGRKLREITDKMNTPCESFNDIDVINDKGRYRRWDKYPYAFRQERLNHIKTHDYGEKVFAHGDLCSDNILVANDGELFIIDFADAVTAPIIYEQAHVASELFRFDKAFLTGYFCEYDADWLTDLCFNGLLIHDFGGDIIEQHIAKPNEITSLKIMRERLYNLIVK